jgi:glycosyltransferase involved in cell wall biosynthesis
VSSGTSDPGPQGRERIYAETLAELQSRIDYLETRVGELSNQVSSHGSEIQKLRLDRQIARFPRWFWTRVKKKLSRGTPREAVGVPTAIPRPLGSPSKRSLAIIVPTFPTATKGYGGQPIERRLSYYRSAGFDVTVVVASRSPGVAEDREGIRILHTRPEELLSVVHDVNPSQVCIHHPLPEHWTVAKELIDRVPVHLWIHGFEARDWRELEYNFTPQEIADQAFKLDAITFDRREAIREAFTNRAVTKIFVSDYMKTVAESFAGIPAENSRIIHNVIDANSFVYEAKTASDRLNILSVRSFARRNYATDLIQSTIELLADEPFFDDLTFSIFGDGQHFDEDTVDLVGLPNVSVTRRFLDAQGMASEFKRHGVILIPTRWDSQGMTMGEAMSAGLVPVSNGVAAIPEFADEQCAFLAGPDDVRGLADGITRMYREPDLFLSMSAAAARRARAQCGPESTVQLEIELLEAAEASTRQP